MTKRKVASLFSGCGGMDIGFEGDFEVHKSCLNFAEQNLIKRADKSGFVKLDSLGFETVFACDVNQKAKEAWNSYFSKKRDVTGVYEAESIVDIVKSIKAGTRKNLSDIDVVTGGFPCNDFSVAGKRLGFSSDKSHLGNKKLLQDNEDPTAENRGMLYYWMREYVAQVKPKIFYAENVKGLVSLGDAKAVIEKDFSSIDGSSYIVVPVKVLNATHYGIPQTRERVIFIGINKQKLKADVVRHIEKHGTLPDALSPYPLQTHGNQTSDGRKILPISTTKSAFAGLKEPELSKDLSQQAYSKAKYIGKKLQGQAEVNLYKAGPTIRAEHHGNIEFRRLSEENGGKNIEELSKGLQQRRLTVRECARIQTFPNDYEFVIPNKLSASDGYRLIGNAVPPLLAYRLAQRVDEIWDELFKKR
ncbi:MULTISPECIES: DNA cytosine methyltransferase [Polynucleobacter]|uniref:Cytosine-specific methyltransferase n=1 Tax=Polynucleobacter asymbioticus TaxID=576611 RepID=A0AAC9IUF5_9BURK|nr:MULTISPECIES: DNA (cytosine-5-)-methyltransferase [Polynucleobacter]APC02236.1 hypothetical protein AOC25_11730 [Polynucleobacter asymbioticus]MBU3558032.1 DNA (cytosine-5-)-methyltransferase [Polynucleobacter sp. Nonnen-W13]